MAKVLKGPPTWIAQMPALLIGADVGEKPNFMAVAWAGMANCEPPIVSAAIRPAQHTLTGIRAHGEFSVNVPSQSQYKKVDFCGLNFGASVNKAQVCGFSNYYGTLQHAPLIEERAVNPECSAVQITELDSRCLVLGKVADIHASEECVSADGKIDFLRVNPPVFLDNPTRKYCTVGTAKAEAFRVGVEL